MYGKGRWRADDRMIQINAAALLPLTMAHGIWSEATLAAFHPRNGWHSLDCSQRGFARWCRVFHLV